MMYLEFLSGSWQYWTNLHVLPTVCLFCFGRFIFQVILSWTLCSFHIVTEPPQPVATEQLPAINFFWPVNFSQVRVHQNVKKCIRGSSMEERLGNTVIENHMHLNSMNSWDDHVCFIHSLNKWKLTPEDAQCAGLCAIFMATVTAGQGTCSLKADCLVRFPTLH